MTALFVVGYLTFGLILMDYLYPAWHFFEKLVGALIWPVVAGVGIYRLVRKR